jgi:hypothetical protein
MQIFINIKNTNFIFFVKHILLKQRIFELKIFQKFFAPCPKFFVCSFYNRNPEFSISVFFSFRTLSLVPGIRTHQTHLTILLQYFCFGFIF